MPVVKPVKDPFTTDSAESVLRVPQARVLAALIPHRVGSPPTEWPVYNRAVLGARAGYTPASGSVTRALNGIHPGSNSGDAHKGLIALGFVEELPLDIDGLVEVNYRATVAGIREYLLFSSKTPLPPVRDAAVCANARCSVCDRVKRHCTCPK